MNLYLVQHAEAVSKDQDPQRPLSTKGVADITKVAEYAAKNCELTVDQIYHSGKLRARQTAEILATALKLPAPAGTEGLAPLDNPAVWANRLKERNENIILVGHLPYMGKMASMLLIGDPENNPVQFQMGGIVALYRDENKFSIQWMIVPAIIP